MVSLYLDRYLQEIQTSEDYTVSGPHFVPITQKLTEISPSLNLPLQASPPALRQRHQLLRVCRMNSHTAIQILLPRPNLHRDPEAL